MTPWLRLREKLENNIDECERVIAEKRKLTRYPDVVEKHLIYMECYQFILSYMKLLQEDEARGFSTEDVKQ